MNTNQIPNGVYRPPVLFLVSVIPERMFAVTSTYGGNSGSYDDGSWPGGSGGGGYGDGSWPGGSGSGGYSDQNDW